MHKNSKRPMARELVAVSLLALIMGLFCLRSVAGNITSYPAYLDFPADTEVYSLESTNMGQNLGEVSISDDLLELALAVREDDTLDLAFAQRNVRGSLERIAIWEYGNRYQLSPTEDSEFLDWNAMISVPKRDTPRDANRTWMICFNDREAKLTLSEWLTINSDGSASCGLARINVFDVSAAARKPHEREGTWRNTLVSGRTAIVVDIEERRLIIFTAPHPSDTQH